MNRPIIVKKIEGDDMKSSKKKIKCPNSITSKFYQTYKD